jgi:hypothetical protein
MRAKISVGDHRLQKRESEMSRSTKLNECSHRFLGFYGTREGNQIGHNKIRLSYVISFGGEPLRAAHRPFPVTPLVPSRYNEYLLLFRTAFSLHFGSKAQQPSKYWPRRAPEIGARRRASIVAKATNGRRVPAETRSIFSFKQRRIWWL